MTFLSKDFWKWWTCCRILSDSILPQYRRHVVWGGDAKSTSCHNRLHRPVKPVYRRRSAGQRDAKFAVNKRIDKVLYFSYDSPKTINRVQRIDVWKIKKTKKLLEWPTSIFPEQYQNNKKEGLWELMKWSPRGKRFDFLTNSLNVLIKRNVCRSTGKFVCGYFGLKVLSKFSSLYMAIYYRSIKMVYISWRNILLTAATIFS